MNLCFSNLNGFSSLTMEDCVVCSDGSTKYVFSPNQYSFVSKHVKGKGLCIISTEFHQKSSIVLSDVSLNSIVCGKNRNRICMECYNRIDKVAKVRGDCKSLSYCSSYCLSKANEFIDVCGSIFDEICRVDVSQQSEGLVDLQFMVVKLLFVYLQQNSILDYLSLETVLKCESHSDLENSELRKLSKSLYALLNSHRSPLLFNAEGKTTFQDSLLYTLLCVFQYNSQPLPVPGLKGVSLLCLFPSLSKLNHSCIPNAILEFGVKEGRVVGYLKLLKDVTPGEEISISYLNQTCLSYENRQELLSQAFQFTCSCTLCTEQCFSSQQSVLDQENDRVIASSTAGTISALTGSSTGTGSEINVTVQIGKAEELLSVSLSGDSINYAGVVTAHDTALLVLQYCQGAAATPAIVATSETTTNSLAVRACLIIAACALQCGGDLLQSRVEVMVMCGQYALKAQMSKEQMAADLIVKTRALLYEAEHILNTHYRSADEKRAEGLLGSDYLSGLGLVRAYHDNLLSRCRQIQSALA